MLPIDELNGLDRPDFGPALAPLFEASAPLAEKLFDHRPYRSYEELLVRAEAAVAELPIEQKIEVINAHPRIGESPETVRLTSTLSYREQGYDREAGLEQEQLKAVYQKLAELNRAYEARFGFRFVVFVNRRPKSDIVEVLEARLSRPREAEMQTALRDMLAIARDRLEGLRR